MRHSARARPSGRAASTMILILGVLASVAAFGAEGFLRLSFSTSSARIAEGTVTAGQTATARIDVPSAVPRRRIWRTCEMARHERDARSATSHCASTPPLRSPTTPRRTSRA